MDEDLRPEPPYAASPVEMTSAFLDFQRATLLWKISGLNDEQVRRSLVPSGISLLSIMKHSAYVERWWFTRVFAGEDAPMGWTEADPDADWRIEPNETTADIVTLYENEIARSREVVKGANWDDVAKYTTKGHTLGWILSHMIEEVSRHNGHADIFRELIDGAVGE